MQIRPLIFAGCSKRCGLTAAQFEARGRLTRREREGEAVIRRDIEAALGLSGPTVGGTPDCLEKRGRSAAGPCPATGASSKLP